MEKKRGLDSGVVKELTQGKELAELLTHHFINSSSNLDPDFLVAEILSCYERAISALTAAPAAATASTAALCCSPQSGSDLSGHVSKKRKAMPRWSQQVQAASSTAGAAFYDGYSWRKYGNKVILGALFPRAYYRCTHRNSQGCLATKQVQQSDHDPTVFHVSYRGRHTCVQSSRLGEASPQETTIQFDQRPAENPEQQQLDPTVMVNFGAGLKVETQELQDLNDTLEDDILPSFSFTCDPVGLDDIFAGDGAATGGYSPSFLSPATSGGSNYFSDLTVSAGTSAANSPVGGLDFSFDNLESFSFDFQNPQN